MSDNRVAVGVFADPQQAEQAFHELRQAGFRDDQLGFIVRDRTALSEDESPWEAFNILKRHCNDSAMPDAKSARTYDPEVTVKLESPQSK